METAGLGTQVLNQPEVRSQYPIIGIDGGIDSIICIPGMPGGFSMASYLRLIHLYVDALEAKRILEKYRTELTLYEASESDNPSQEPLTPLVASNHVENLFYKCEYQTVTRAYKLRGATVCMAKMMECGRKRFLAVSTGNHALGVLKAAELLNPDSVRIVVPRNTASGKAQKIRDRVAALLERGVHAEVVFAGDAFDDAREWAMAQDDGEYYIDPYNDRWVVAGQGTIGLELFYQLVPLVEARPDLKELQVVVPVGGGGLLAGTATALKLAFARDFRFSHLKVNVLGLRLADLGSVLGDAIRVQELAPDNQVLFDLLRVETLRITDEQMAEGARFAEADRGAPVEGAAGGTLYPVRCLDAYRPSQERLSVCVLSGGNVPKNA